MLAERDVAPTRANNPDPTLLAADYPTRPPRLVYPHSVIPGGAGSPAELLESMRRDGVVAEHYRRLRLKQLTLIQNLRERLAYVSYRAENEVYWTRKRVRIGAGELLLGDGEVLIRSRCGNQISAVPREPTSGDEPSEEAMNHPVAWPGTGWVEPVQTPTPDFLLLPVLSEESTSWLPGTASRDFPIYVPVGPGATLVPVVTPGTPTPRVQEPMATPEPAVGLLAAAGLLLLVSARLRKSHFESRRDFSHLSVSEPRPGEN